MSIRVERIPNKRGRDSFLLRQSWREGHRIRKKTLANLTDLPPDIIAGFDAVARGGVSFQSLGEGVSIKRSLPHGHAAATLGLARKVGLERILARKPGRMRDLALAAIVARVIAPGSKLATARRLSCDTATTSLGSLLGLGQVSGNEMLAMLDWLRKRQPWIEKSLASRYLKQATLILYDITSSLLEGRCCPLAAFGHNRDGKKGKKQIVFGLLCTPEGCPIAVDVFSGNTADPSTVGHQVKTIQDRFGIERIALVGDRGMITTARIREDIRPAGLDWISALKTVDLRKLVTATSNKEAVLRPEDLVDDAVAEITSPDYPGERLMVCLNPRLRAERARKREALLRATEETLEKIAVSVHMGRLKGKAEIGRRVGREANRRKVEKHFTITITDDELSWRRRTKKIADEARLDGIYVIRTSLGSGSIGPQAAVAAYKSLSRVERAFRTAKSHLRVRPIHVYSAEHVRAHVFLCMLAGHVEWHMRQALAPLLFEDDDRARVRVSPVAPARVSGRAQRKAETKTTSDGFPVHSFETLMDDLATLTLNSVSLPGHPGAVVPMVSEPTEIQERAMELIGIRPARTVPSAVAG